MTGEDIELARAACAVSLKKSDELRASAARLLEKHPDSAQAFRLTQIALARLKQWAEAEKLASARLKRLPDDPLALEFLAAPGWDAKITRASRRHASRSSPGERLRG